MKRLRDYGEYAFVKTQVVCLEKFAGAKNIFVKLEGENLNKSIKSRTAYFLFKDILSRGRFQNVVESSSGNLGLSLGYFAKRLDVNFLCLVDETVPELKLRQLQEADVQYEKVSLGNFPDYRTARITYAKALDRRPDWVWTNQYDNLANAEAHYQTIGPELFEQLNEDIDFFVCSLGSGGTISGVSRYLKEKSPDVKVVAVEPNGSTIFGGETSKYITAGSGLSYPSGIMRAHWNLFDYYAKVSDSMAIQTCLDMQRIENIAVGITSGAALYVAKYLSEKYKDKRITCISPDGGQFYQTEFDNYHPEKTGEPEIHKVDLRMLG